MSKNQKLVQKSIRFPEKVVDVLEKDALEKYGFGFNKLMQFEALKLVEEVNEKKAKYASGNNKLINAVLQGRDEHKKGLTEPIDDIDEFVDSL